MFRHTQRRPFSPFPRITQTLSFMYKKFRRAQLFGMGDLTNIILYWHTSRTHTLTHFISSMPLGSIKRIDIELRFSRQTCCLGSRRTSQAWVMHIPLLSFRLLVRFCCMRGWKKEGRAKYKPGTKKRLGMRCFFFFFALMIPSQRASRRRRTLFFPLPPL